MLRRYLIATLTLVAIARSDNIGWKGYFVESPQEFHDIPLVWESGNTTVPSWLTGIFVKNGPAQVSFYYIEVNFSKIVLERRYSEMIVHYFSKTILSFLQYHSIHLVLQKNISAVG